MDFGTLISVVLVATITVVLSVYVGAYLIQLFNPTWDPESRL